MPLNVLTPHLLRSVPRWVVVVAACLAVAELTCGQAVFVGDSPAALQGLERARALAQEDPQRAADLLGQVVLEHGDALVRAREDANLFHQAREAVLALLQGDPRLAQAWADRGRGDPRTGEHESDLARARTALSLARFAQLERILEQGAFDSRTRAILTGLAAIGRGDASDLHDQVQALDLAGHGGDARALRSWFAARPAAARGVDALRPIEGATVLGLVDEPFWVHERADDSTPTLPVLLGDDLLLHAGHVIECIDSMTGTVRWRRDLRTAGASRSSTNATVQRVAADADTIVAVTGLGGSPRSLAPPLLMALDTSTGETRWSVDPGWSLIDGGQRTAWPGGLPVLADGIVLQPMRRTGRARITESWLAGFDIDTGATRWQSFLGSTASPRASTRRGQSHGIVDGAHVYIASPLGVVACISVADGGIRWLRRLPPSNELTAQARARMPWEFDVPVLWEDELLLRVPDGRSVVRLNRHTGQLLEQDESPRWSDARYIVDAGESILAVGTELSAHAPGDPGDPLWTVRLNLVDQNDPLAGRVLVAGEVIVVPHATGLDLRALEDGRVLATLVTPGGGQVVAGPAGLTLADADTARTWVDLDLARDQLNLRAANDPEDAQSVITLVNLATRGGDLELLHDVLPKAVFRVRQWGEDADTDNAIDAVIGAMDLLSPGSARDRAAVDDARTALAAEPGRRAKMELAMGDWTWSVSPAESMDRWTSVLEDPAMSTAWHVQEQRAGPAAGFAAARLRQAGRPTLWPEPPGGDHLDDQLTRIRHKAAAGVPLDPHALAHRAAAAGRPRTALAVLALSDLDTSDSATTFGLIDAPPLATASEPRAPRAWPGTLVQQRSTSTGGGFLRRDGSRLIWHEGDQLDPRWSVSVAQEGAFLVDRGRDHLLVITQHPHGLGAIRLGVSDGSVEWIIDDLDAHLPGSAGLVAGLPARTPTGRPLDRSRLLLPVVSESSMIVSRRDGALAGVDLETGETLWTGHTGDDLVLATARWTRGAALLTASHLLHVEARSGIRTVHPLPADLGDPTWLNVGELGLVVVSGTRGIGAIGAPDGPWWWVSMDERVRGSRGALILPDAVVVTPTGSAPSLLDPATGEHRAEVAVDQAARLMHVRPMGDSVLLLDDNGLTLLDESGTTRWRNVGGDIGEPLLAVPAGKETLLISSLESSPIPLGLGVDRHSTWHRVQRLDPHGRIRGSFDLFPVAGAIRDAWTVAGALVFSTDTEVVMIDLPEYPDPR